MSSFFGWLFGYDKVQQGITQNTDGIANLSNIAAQAAKKTDALASQITGISDAAAKAAEQTAATVGELAKLSGKSEDAAAKLANVVNDVSGLTEQSAETAGKLVELSTETTEKLAGLSEKVTELSAQSAEAAAHAEKINMIAIAIAAVAVVAVTTFIAFLVYQGIKVQKEKNSFSGTPTSTNKEADLITLGDPSGDSITASESTISNENERAEDLSSTGSVKNLNLINVGTSVQKAA